MEGGPRNFACTVLTPETYGPLKPNPMNLCPGNPGPTCLHGNGVLRHAPLSLAETGLEYISTGPPAWRDDAPGVIGTGEGRFGLLCAEISAGSCRITQSK